MNKIKAIKISLLIAFLFFFGFLGLNPAKAAGLVPCHPKAVYTTQIVNGNLVQQFVRLDDKCTICDLFVLAKNVITFMIEIAIALAVLFIVIGAFNVMIAGGSEERVKTGKKMMTMSITGVIMVLAAWLLVGTILQVLTDSPSKLPWTKIECVIKE